MNGNKSDAIPRSGETKPCKIKEPSKQSFQFFFLIHCINNDVKINMPYPVLLYCQYQFHKLPRTVL